MSLPVRLQPLRKLPVVWNHRKAAFLFFISVCVPLCVCMHCTPSCVCVWNESPVLDEEVAPALPEVVLWVTPSHGSPRADALTISLSSLCQAQSLRQILCCPGAKSEEGLMLYLDTYCLDPQRQITKTSPKLISGCGLHLLSKLLQMRNCVSLLTNVLLWIPGAEIVQWLMKNLSIEDPGMPAEQSVITCKHKRAQLKRKAILNHAPLPSLCLPSCQQLKPSTLGVWSLPMATSSPSLTTSWHLKMMEPFIAFRYIKICVRRPLSIE